MTASTLAQSPAPTLWRDFRHVWRLHRDDPVLLAQSNETWIVAGSGTVGRLGIQRSGNTHGSLPGKRMRYPIPIPIPGRVTTSTRVGSLVGRNGMDTGLRA
jgi:hypothetical protein